MCPSLSNKCLKFLSRVFHFQPVEVERIRVSLLSRDNRSPQAENGTPWIKTCFKHLFDNKRHIQPEKSKYCSYMFGYASVYGKRILVKPTSLGVVDRGHQAMEAYATSHLQHLA